MATAKMKTPKMRDTTTPAKPQPQPEGLIGFYGHTFENIRDRRRVKNQFRVVRALPPGRWVVELYSFLTGFPSGDLKVFAEAYLLSDDVALYLDDESWREACAHHKHCFKDE